MTRRRRSRGEYSRHRATRVGPGAAELLWPTITRLRNQQDEQLPVGVASVFERTLYLALPVPTEWSRSPLVALGTGSLRDDPLVIPLDTSPGFSFRQFNGTPNDDCTICLHDTRQQTERLSIQFDRSATVDIEVELLPRLPCPGGRYDRFSLRRFAPASESLSTHRSLLRWHLNVGTADGLGYLEALAGRHEGGAGTELADVVDAVVDVIVGGYRRSPSSTTTATTTTTEADRQTVIDSCVDQLLTLLGRGPGTTPAGDDFLVGLLLVLLSVDDETTVEWVRSVGTRLVESAHGRTTEVSIALLNQAIQRRAGSPVTACLDALLGEASYQAQQRAAAELVEVGHTSGADTLVGVLTATTAVLPMALERTE